MRPLLPYSFFIHKSIQALAHDIVQVYAKDGYRAVLFPNPRAASRCMDYVRKRAEPGIGPCISALTLALDTAKDVSASLKKLSPVMCAVLVPSSAFPLAKQYWQHTGDGVSSRRAEFFHDLFRDGLLVPLDRSGPTSQLSPGPSGSTRPFKGPKRYHRPGSVNGLSTTSARQFASAEAPVESSESSRFLEERFGRNLDMCLVERARLAISRRIAGSLVHDAGLQDGPLPDPPTNARGMRVVAEEDVYLFPAGMNAIFNAHSAVLAARPPRKSINFGFPYVDTLKVLQKFGPGCLFYGHGSNADFDDLEARLQAGERYNALFCEFPGNPLLACPDLQRIRSLADKYDFVVVVDETIGTFANIDVLHAADIVVTSLTKIFSGDANVMGGAAVLNPRRRYYGDLKEAMRTIYEDTLWPEDVVFLERNSRDFLERVDRINVNAEAICDVLHQSPLVKTVYYPKCNPTKPNYEACRLPTGGYGGLLSVVFQQKSQAQAFYDAMETAKGPSLGTNFTLCSPYVVLAHYGELSWAAEYGVDPDLVRVSVGLEDTQTLEQAFRKALRAAGEVGVA